MNNSENFTDKQEQVTIGKATFGESIDFKSLFRVKGEKVLFISLTGRNRSGMVGMGAFTERRSISVHYSKLERLSDYKFIRNIGLEDLRMPQVFDNLNAVTDEELKSFPIHNVMEIMVPSFDEKRFNDFHARRVLDWYFEIKEKIKSFNQVKE